jgi:hypothetical protein
MLIGHNSKETQQLFLDGLLCEKLVYHCFEEELVSFIGIAKNPAVFT